jgi:hypothetical protein
MATRTRIVVGSLAVIATAIASVVGLRAIGGPDAGWAAVMFTIPVGAIVGWWIGGGE